MNTDPEEALGAAIVAALREAGADLPTRPATRVAIAYSGGADSTAMLHAAAALQAQGLFEVVALHVHHGLAAAADDWLARCREQATTFGVAFDSEHVRLARRGTSIEAEARALRYAALTALCRRHRCAFLMTAHHRDDQAETVLVNLARGAGVGGLAATAKRRRLDDVVVLRPLLDLPASTLRAHVATHALSHVEDPSNDDRRYTRNAIRHEVMPVLRRIVPSIAERLAQTATHAASMQGLLDDIGREDLARGTLDDATDDIDVETLAALTPARAANALRVWLARRGMRAPSAAALAEMLDQLLHASPNAQIELLHERHALRLYRGRVAIEAGTRPRAGFVALAWHDDATIEVAAWNGRLRFDRATDQGFDPAVLQGGALTIRERRGGERLRIHRDGPSRTLKNLYQEAGIPAWRRSRLPLVYLDDLLIFAAGIGADATLQRDASDAAPAVRIGWEEDAAPPAG